jgi:hypothetical protein
MLFSKSVGRLVAASVLRLTRGRVRSEVSKDIILRLLETETIQPAVSSETRQRFVYGEAAAKARVVDVDIARF